jgi:hypothetical protein
MGAGDLCQEVEHFRQGIKLKSAPVDGYRVLPVAPEHTSCWPSSPEAMKEHPLDNWGPEYWAFWTPSDRISKATSESLNPAYKCL